jgi:YgiT-type zinc finger domain-containing protein
MDSGKDVKCNQCGGGAVATSAHVVFAPNGGPLQTILEIECPACGIRQQPAADEPLEADRRD